MEEEPKQLVSPSTEGLVEERMLGRELVREMIARRERGDGIKLIARELVVDRKTVTRWLRLADGKRGNHSGEVVSSIASLSLSSGAHRKSALMRWCFTTSSKGWGFPAV